jgi:hypothetical protein
MPRFMLWHYLKQMLILTRMAQQGVIFIVQIFLIDKLVNL